MFLQLLIVKSFLRGFFFQLRVGPINDGDSFDTDRLSGSIQYDDDPPMDDDDDLPPAPAPAPRMTDDAGNRKDQKKSKKKEVRNA